MKIASAYSRVLVAVMLLAVSTMIFAGCFGRRHTVSNNEYPRELQSVRFPEFLSGPAAALLTNDNGYSAQITAEQTGDSNSVRIVSGQLLVRGSHLLFAPKNSDSTFIWDLESRNGFILSEALQGYAPVSGSGHYTKVSIISEMAGPAGEQVNGHLGHDSEVAVSSDDGSTANFDVWCASDLNGFPIRIRSLKSAPPLTLNLADVRSENLALKLFQPPDGFTKYANSDAMVGELFARKSKQKNISNGTSVEPKSGVEYSH